ncbi:peroxidase-related enzyme [Zafaria sp. J156]|uniref:peroxidase-related enzyme n=1 Tax=Zafaria sp. J156 TaxID=3116490 RepID=UPI002E78252C|nr:peroxidase-related enzyme [Zafaria sp. J156]MEE1622577.1 peroxidase-related enzyme [Zafaria sp. J156]
MSTLKEPLGSLRPSLRDLTERAFDAAFGSGAPEGITSLDAVDRLRIGLSVAKASGHEGFEAELRRLLDEAAGQGASAVIDDDARWPDVFDPWRVALFDHVSEIAVDPASTGRSGVEALQEAGVSDAVIVAASQVASFAAFFARLRIAADALERAGEAVPTTVPFSGVPEGQPGHPRAEYPLMDWTGFVSAAVDPNGPGAADDAKGASDYYGVLSHEPGFLALRTRLYDEIMTGGEGGERVEGGAATTQVGGGVLDRAEREFVALSTSLTTGCGFCASVHGRRHFFMSKDTVSTPRLKHGGVGALESVRERALATVGAALAVSPPALAPGHLAALLAEGASRSQVMDAAAVASMFAWANRLMLTLGEGHPAGKASA